MNVFHKVTLQALRKNKTRTAVTIIGIILSAAMICAVTTFASSLRNYGIENTAYVTGSWHANALSVDYGAYESIAANGKVDRAVYLQRLGYALAEGSENPDKPYLYVLGAGPNAQELLPIHLLAGTYPTNADEILLPSHLSENGGVQYQLGDTLKLSLGERVSGGETLGQNTPYLNTQENAESEELAVREDRTYTVVGFYQRPDFEDYSAPGYTALTAADSALGGYTLDVYYEMKDPADTFTFLEEMANNGYGGEANDQLLALQGVFGFDTFSAALANMSVIVIILIMCGSISLIYNAFAISVSQRTRQFGLLSSIGATRKQLRHMVYYEALVVSAIGIPLGIAAGIGGIGVTLLLIGDKFASLGFPMGMTLSVSPLSIVAAVVVSLVTVLISAWVPSRRATRVSAVEAIRQVQDVKAEKRPVRTSRITYALFGLSGVLAMKHYRRSRKKYRATVLSLFMSIVLFVSAASFTSYLQAMVNRGLEGYGFDLDYNLTPDQRQDIDADALLQLIRSTDRVTDAVYSNGYTYRSTLDKGQLGPQVQANADNVLLDETEDTGTFYVFPIFVDDEAFLQLLRQNGLQEQDYFDPDHPLAIAFDDVRFFQRQQGKFQSVDLLKDGVDAVSVQMERHMPGYTSIGRAITEEGDDVWQYLDNTSGETMNLPIEEAMLDTQLHIGATLTEYPFYLSSNIGLTLLYPYSMQPHVVQQPAEDATLFYFIRSDAHRQSYQALREALITRGFPADRLTNYAEAVESNRNLILIIRVFSYGFIVLISLIAAANVFNTISTNVLLRRREFAMLKSVGMGDGQFRRMMRFECLLYGCRSLILGLPVSVVVSYLFYQSVLGSVEMSFHLPWAAMGIAALSVFAVVFATMVYATGKVRRDNPIDTLKSENL